MKEFLIYVIVLFISPFISGFFNFLSFLVGGLLNDLYASVYKKEKKGVFLDIVLFVTAFFSNFLTVLILNELLGYFSLGINWIFIASLVILFLINNIKRISASKNTSRNFEIYECIADIMGIIAAFLYLMIFPS
jgi:hypothetical protein